MCNCMQTDRNRRMRGGGQRAAWTMGPLEARRYGRHGLLSCRSALLTSALLSAGITQEDARRCRTPGCSNINKGQPGLDPVTAVLRSAVVLAAPCDSSFACSSTTPAAGTRNGGLNTQLYGVLLKKVKEK